MKSDSVGSFAELLSKAAVICEPYQRGSADSSVKTRNLNRLLAMALKRTVPARAVDELIVRTIHHLPCTGGTLFAKCIAAMPNAIILNEIAPHSNILDRTEGRRRFSPSDFIALLKQADHSISSELISKITTSSIRIIAEEQYRVGRKLVLRDHSHSDFLFDAFRADEPPLLNLIPQDLAVLSIVTVRNPLDSYMSMRKQGWDKHFTPSTLKEYSSRYLSFLDKYKGLPIFKYEDFTDRVYETMEEICDALSLNFSPSFEKTFSYFEFSGDSGRSNKLISTRSRRVDAIGLTPDLASDIRSEEFRALCKKLDYKEPQ